MMNSSSEVLFFTREKFLKWPRVKVKPWWLPSCFLNALAGRGVHIVTVNDYLSKRDSEWMGPIFEFHGLTVDCIDKHQPNSDSRRKAYLADITYGTNNEFGFDYLRDNMAD